MAIHRKTFYLTRLHSISSQNYGDVTGWEWLEHHHLNRCFWSISASLKQIV